MKFNFIFSPTININCGNRKEESNTTNVNISSFNNSTPKQCYSKFLGYIILFLVAGIITFAIQMYPNKIRPELVEFIRVLSDVMVRVLSKTIN